MEFLGVVIGPKGVEMQKEKVEGVCYESPKKEMVSYTFKHLIQNLKSYNGVEI